MQRRIANGLALAFLFASLGAAQGPNNSEAKPAPSNPPKHKPEVVKQVDKSTAYQIVTASWYGEFFDGKPTASGEPYDMYDMTAASLTIPLGTYVKVTNLHNGKAIVVKVNDRGPVVPGRILDLSYGAACALQFEHKGLQRVRIEPVKRPERKSVYTAVAYNHPSIELAQ